MSKSVALNQILIDVLDAESRRFVCDGPLVATETTCLVEGCNRARLARGFCNAHYLRHRQNRNLVDPVQTKRSTSRQCIEVNCSEIVTIRGGWDRCPKHFKRYRTKILKRALVNYFGGRCSHCLGIFPDRVYDFHHTSDKQYSPSEVISSGALPKIAAELEKCIMLCANCHRIEHGEAEDVG